MDKVLVTGGTGSLGRRVVDQLILMGRKVCVLTSRSDAVVPTGVEIHRGSLENISELYEAVRGAGTIIHCASSPQNFQSVDIGGTKNLLSAISDKGNVRLIYISIVGIHKSSYPYYKAKLEVEKIIADSENPFTILRTSQFHDFVYRLIDTGTIRDGSVLKVPSGMRFQSVDITEVADELVALCNKPDRGLLNDFGGPEVLTFEEMVRSYVELSGQQIQIEPADIPGPRFELFRSGVNLSPDNATGKITWKHFLVKSTN